MKSLAIIFALVMSLSGCQDLKELPGSYQVIEVDGKDIKDEEVTLIIEKNEEGNRISGNNGCNQYGGEFNINDEGILEIGMLMSTKMYCMQKADLEKNYMAALNKVHTASVEKEYLILMDKDGKVTIKAQRINE